MQAFFNDYFLQPTQFKKHPSRAWQPGPKIPLMAMTI